VLAQRVALLLLFAVLPTAELAEQVAHVVEHVLHDEPAVHSAHHDGERPAGGDEHGCTGLIHLCGCHQALLTSPTAPATLSVEILDTMAIQGPHSLHDQRSLEPPHRPPIG
jgi:hypothetical protein